MRKTIRTRDAIAAVVSRLILCRLEAADRDNNAARRADHDARGMVADLLHINQTDLGLALDDLIHEIGTGRTISKNERAAFLIERLAYWKNI